MGVVPYGPDEDEVRLDDSGSQLETHFWDHVIGGSPDWSESCRCRQRATDCLTSATTIHGKSKAFKEPQWCTSAYGTAAASKCFVEGAPPSERLLPAKFSRDPPVGFSPALAGSERPKTPPKALPKRPPLTVENVRQPSDCHLKGKRISYSDFGRGQLRIGAPQTPQTPPPDLASDVSQSPSSGGSRRQHDSGVCSLNEDGTMTSFLSGGDVLVLELVSRSFDTPTGCEINRKTPSWTGKDFD
eukprot:s2293_g2.t1